MAYEEILKKINGLCANMKQMNLRQPGRSPYSDSSTGNLMRTMDATQQMPGFGVQDPLSQGVQTPIKSMTQESGSSIAPLMPSADTVMPTMGNNTAMPSMTDRISKAFQDPVTQGLMSAGLTMMATPPRDKPYSNLEILGQGGMAGMNAMNAASQNLMNNDVRKIDMQTKINNMNLMNSPLPKEIQDKTGLKTIGQASQTGSFVKLLSPPNATENKTDFTTFKAGRPKRDDESAAEWNKRVSDEWEARQDKRSQNKVIFNNSQNEGKGFSTWSPEEKNTSFETYRFTGKKPNFGSRDASGKAKWEQENNRYMAKNGGARQFAADQAKFKSDTASYQNVKKASDMTDVAIKQTDHNADALKVASDNYSRSNYPAPNKLMNWSAEQFGSPQKQKEFAQFKLALMAFSREYMRVVTGAARSVAELSVGAQASADEILSKFSSWQTLQAQVDQAKVEIANVHKAYKGTLRDQSIDLYGKDPMNDGEVPASNLKPFDVPIKTKDGRDVKTLSDKELLKLLNRK